MDNELRTFTIEEANQLIPDLTKLIVLIQEKHNDALALEAQIDALELVADSKGKKSVVELNRLTELHHRAVSEFYAIMDEIHKYGCIVKDVSLGLIDFYAVLDGKVVYLCWKLGEYEVSFWHGVGQGFPARRPLSASPNDETGKDAD